MAREYGVQANHLLDWTIDEFLELIKDAKSLESQRTKNG